MAAGGCVFGITPKRARSSRRTPRNFRHRLLSLQIGLRINSNLDATIRCLDNCLQPGDTAKYPPVTVSERYLGKLMRVGHSKVAADKVPMGTKRRLRRSLYSRY